MKIGDLFVRLGVQADTFTVRDFTKAIGDIPLSVASAVTSLTGLSVGFVELTKNTLDIANNLGVFRAETGLSITELQRWQAVAKEAGISGDSVQNAVMRISQAMAQLKLGHADQNFMLALGQLGVGTRGKDPFQIFQEILQKAGKKGAVGTALLQNIGFNPELMRLATLSPGQIAKGKAGGVVMTESDLKAIQELQVSLAEFGLVIEKEFVPILKEFEPYMKDFADALGFIITKLGGFTIKGLGEDAKIFNYIRKVGVGQFINGLAGDTLTKGDLGGMHYEVYQNVIQNIHSTAPAHELAGAINKRLTEEKIRATNHFKNSGLS